MKPMGDDNLNLFIEQTGEDYLKAIFTTETIGIPSFRQCFLERLYEQQKGEHLDEQAFCRFYLEKAQREEWGEKAYARLMCALKIDKILWAEMGQYSEVFWQEYFKDFSLNRILLNQVPLEEIFLKLLDYKKSDEVFSVLPDYIDAEKKQEDIIKFPASRAVDFLKEHADSLAEIKRDIFPYSLEEIFTWLEQQKTPLEDLVSLELLFKEWIKLQNDNKRGFKSTFEKFAQDPEFFCDYAEEKAGFYGDFGFILSSYRLPGMNEKREVDPQILLAWTTTVRDISQERGFLDSIDIFS